MSFAHGRKCRVVLDKFDFTGLFKGAEFKANVDTADVSVFGTDWKAFVPGQVGSTLSLDGFYDNSQQASVTALVAVPTPFVATIGPAGLAVGDMARLIQAETTDFTQSSPIGDAVLMNLALLSTQETGLGWCVSSPTANTVGTSTGTAVDTGGLVNGATWVAHFHLHSISATNIVMKVQDSANGVSGWADIAGVTSGTLTAAGTVRVTGTGNVRQYLRASWVITGGATTAVITTAFARRA